jgi:arylsulfatase A-like enzyme
MTRITLILLLLLAAMAAARAVEPPHIILMMSDDQGWGDTGYDGAPGAVTPNLDAMAANGLIMDRFYAHPKCSPTRASLLTGRNGHRYQFFNGISFPQRERTIAQVLAEGGKYRTGHFGKWHLGRLEQGQTPVTRGFQTFLSHNNFFETNPTFIGTDGASVSFTGDGSVATVTSALAFIGESVAARRPSFTLVWFGSPHPPHVPTAEDLEVIGSRTPRAGYLAEIHGIDRAIGRMRAGLRDMGIANNTLLVYHSDNGIAGSHGGLRGGKETLWEGGVRVPAVLEWPGRVRPGRTSMPISVLDWAPTVAGLAGVPITMSGPIDGIDLTPLLDGRMTSRPRPIPVAYFGANSLIDERFKIILGDPNCEQKGRVPPMSTVNTDGPWHFFDLASDPRETADAAAKFPTEFARLQQAMINWLQSEVGDRRNR